MSLKCSWSLMLQFIWPLMCVCLCVCLPEYGKCEFYFPEKSREAEHLLYNCVNMENLYNSSIKTIPNSFILHKLFSNCLLTFLSCYFICDFLILIFFLWQTALLFLVYNACQFVGTFWEVNLKTDNLCKTEEQRTQHSQEYLSLK